MPKLSEILGDSFTKIPENIQKKYKDIDLVDSKNYVEKTELDTVNNSIKDYKKQLKDRDKQLEDLKDKAKGNEELTAEIEKLKEENKNAAKDYEAKIEKLNFDTKLDKALTGAKAKNPKTVKALLNLENLKLDGEDIIGLKEQLEALKESDGYLFDENSNKTNSNSGGTGNIGNPGDSNNGGSENNKGKSLGERLAAEKVEAVKVSENLDSFFLK
ncbi:phage scaffolding protein [Clostridium tyrobutyricum]|uniref:phage scaffolding protein n=1 Tax=Clostridium tyrobutyricum TaxID=1519 RepID=UPI001C393D57|nr:phage scaffolding protein [Clostridium tyrobutyricum]MBV4441145.1 phage scaffolding protein [Clostridium tyrobutyricum]